MADRLPPPWGTRIDREQRIAFTFGGRTRQGYAGDSLASALLGAGVWVLSRSFKYHRPRAPLTMAGGEANTLVQVGAEPNVQAERRALSPGLVVTPQNAMPAAGRDLLGGFDRLGRFLPVGFYYRAFFGPGDGTWQRVWEPLFRRIAGLGRIDPARGAGTYRTHHRHTDVLVVGGGPAGLAAARAAAGAGAQVLLVDQEPDLGGSLTYARAQPEVPAVPGVEVLTGATCNGWFADGLMPVLQGDRLIRVRAAQVVIATGTQDQPLVFRNNDLPGILTASAAQRLMRHYAVRPGRRAVVVAGTPDGADAALDLASAGVEIAAVLLPPGATQPGDREAALDAAGLRVIRGAAVTSATGRHHLRALDVTGPGGAERIACDLAVIDAGTTPAYQLPLQAGARLTFDDATGRFALTDLPPALHLAGAVAGRHAPAAVLRSGEIAGLQAAAALGHAVTLPPAADDAQAPHHRTFDLGPPHPGGRDFVDFDEDLQVKDIVNAVADGYDELQLVKRYSTVGMGPSQGRHAALATARIVARETGRSVAEIGVTTARPPLGPESLGQLAGNPRPLERTGALDSRHRALGARMIPVGHWWRPLRYAGPDAVAEEVRSVRESVGMFDVSTLGKLAVRGPDAGAFLDRIYTMRHATQPVGRVRYCLALTEMGSVLDDGVAFRLAEDDFYVTATTGAVDRLYSQMLHWNAHWRLDVDIQNVAGAFTGINVTGPAARDLLSALSGDIDLGASAFPFLAGRSGHVAGCPVRMMRIGFSGELSFELHVPRSFGPALWDALAAEGAAHGLRPYGLEASRILRLEKGHIIIGQDTDALSTPDELGMGWALSKRKTDHVGRAAVEARRALPQSRRQVRFRCDATAGADLGESCLVMRGGAPAGHVTSVALSPTLGMVIGLAHAHPEDAATGRIILRDRKGKPLTAEVVEGPFYDPENARQDL